MPEVLIHRCTLRVVRRGGWNWGPEPKQMLENVVRHIPELLARKLEQFFAAEEDREFSAPIQIRIPIRLDDLLSETRNLERVGATATPRTMPLFEDKLDSALRKLFRGEQSLNVKTTEDRRLQPFTPASDDNDSTNRPRSFGAVARMLAKWHAAGILDAQLASFPREQIEAWHYAVWRHYGASASEGIEPDPAIHDAIQTLVKTRASLFVGEGRETRLRLRLRIAAEVGAQHRIPLDGRNLLAAVNRIFPVDDDHVTEGSKPKIPERNLERQNHSGRAHRKAEGDVHVACALPFLLLSPLTRLDYFETVAAVLEAAELSDQAPLFAAALAYKVLDAPERGWRRTPASLCAAAAFAGLQEPPANDLLAEFSRQLARHTQALDSLLTEALLRGHTAGDTVLLRRAELESSSGFMLIEVNGCFPIAWTEDLQQVIPILKKLAGSIVLVSREAAGPSVLRELDEAGFSFVSDVPPTRGESWRRIQQGPLPLGWTNDRDPDSLRVLRAARDFAAASEEAATLWETFGEARPGVVHGHSSPLDRTLTLSAAVACGAIAWELWRERGRTTPQLVLERFCDLDGRVRFSPETITVRLPLGRRHQELLQRGLLSPVRDIPWFGGRPVELGGD